MDQTFTPSFEKPATLRSKVEAYLRESIMEGRLRGGERLREQELCDQLGVSRPTLREALRTLEAERLITIEPHRGPTVRQVTVRAARDLYALRGQLEGFAAREFARIADDAEVRQLQAAVRELHRQAKVGGQQGLLNAKREFYDVLLAGCGNELVKHILSGMLSQVNLLRATTLSRPERLPQSLAEIDLLVGCICARDPLGAEQAARVHIENALLAALAVLAEQPQAASAMAATTTTSRENLTKA